MSSPVTGLPVQGSLFPNDSTQSATPVSPNSLSSTLVSSREASARHAHGQGQHQNPPPSLLHVAVAQWTATEHPADKVMDRGSAALSDAELLSVLLTKGGTVGGERLTTLDVARALLHEYGSLYRLSLRRPGEITSAPGVGRRTAARLAAAFELMRRIQSQHAEEERVQVCGPEDVAAIYLPLMRDLHKEVFRVVELSTANVILRDYVISEGGLSSTVVEPRAVFGEAILNHAASIVCLHNHPSGNPEPSREDIRMTRQLVEAGQLMGIPVYDHIIIAGATYTSLAERGVIS